jgi:hypothetical protein
MTDDATSPEFGPGGYLPPKASKRARKIVLREQMGRGWPLAALLASVLVAMAGVAYLYVASRAPGPPFVAVGAITAVPANGAAVLSPTADDSAVLVLRAGGPVRAFATPDPVPQWCATSRRLETATAAWSADGRLVAGTGRSLQPLRSTVHDGVVYVDSSTALPAPTPAQGSQPLGCAGQPD